MLFIKMEMIPKNNRQRKDTGTINPAACMHELKHNTKMTITAVII